MKYRHGGMLAVRMWTLLEVTVVYFITTTNNQSIYYRILIVFSLSYFNGNLNYTGLIQASVTTTRLGFVRLVENSGKKLINSHYTHLNNEPNIK